MPPACTRRRPGTRKEWATVADSAAAIVELGNLMLLGNRAIDKGDWVRLTRKFSDAGKAALVAAEAKQKEGVFAAGGELDETYDACHGKYQRQ